MKCPNCNTLLDRDAKACFVCGEVITEEFRQASVGSQDKEFDEVIQNLILTDEFEMPEDDLQLKLEQKKQDNRKLKLYQQRYRYMSYATLAVLLLFFLSLFLNWYKISGTVAYHGFFYTEKTASFLSDGVKNYNKESLKDLREEVATFSAQQLLSYAKEYDSYTREDGLLSRLQVYYAKSLYIIYLLLILCAVILLLDRRARFSEWIRISSILAVIYVLLNTLAMKLPYINFIVLNAKKVLSNQGIASRVVAKGLFLFEKDKLELTYQAGLGWGLKLAVALLILWFVFATILTEMSRFIKDKTV